MAKVHVVLCGGRGTRLWPLSRTLLPKQFYPLHGGSLFERTLERMRKLVDDTLVAVNCDQEHLARRVTGDSARYLVEPVGRNTAPAIALCALRCSPEDVLIVTPSDHAITDQSSYSEAIHRGSELAEKGHLVTFGIKPSHPETGYGYIEHDGEQVKSFREKPDLETAKTFLNKGNFLWNSGIFVFKAGVFLRELSTHCPKVFEAAQKASDPERPSLESMQAIPSISVDYAVFEKSDNIRVVAVDMGWSDLGGHDALANFLEKEEALAPHRNYFGKGNAVVASQRDVAIIGADDLIVVDEPDALLICKKGQSHHVKELFNDVERERPELTVTHQRTFRPWGHFTNLTESAGYKVKQISVNPGHRLSLQSHEHRSEHWTVVRGHARVDIDDQVLELGPNQSCEIPLKAKHRLTNTGNEELIIVEVQCGGYLGEDDITRYHDDYHR